MVKITNGVNIFEVTRGAYEGIYSKQGYSIMDEKKRDNGHVEAPGKSDDELFVEAIVEKPLSQWNKDEVKRFAALSGIDISGTKNANEAKSLIKDYIDAVSEAN